MWVPDLDHLMTWPKVQVKHLDGKSAKQKRETLFFFLFYLFFFSSPFPVR